MNALVERALALNLNYARGRFVGAGFRQGINPPNLAVCLCDSEGQLRGQAV